jgi:hypothetical protein
MYELENVPLWMIMKFALILWKSQTHGKAMTR